MDVIPGVADHDCPLEELDLRHIRRVQKSQKIPIYKNVWWDTLAGKLEEVENEIKPMTPTIPVKTLWTMFQKATKEGIERHIQWKTLKNIRSLSFITRDLKKN